MPAQVIAEVMRRQPKAVQAGDRHSPYYPILLSEIGKYANQYGAAVAEQHFRRKL